VETTGGTTPMMKAKEVMTWNRQPTLVIFSTYG